MTRLIVLPAFCVFIAFIGLAHGQDWPTYMHDSFRSGVTDAQLELPDIIYGDIPASFAQHEDPDRNYLTGIVGSSGYAKGRARIILDPAEAPVGLTREDIIVVPFSDTSWTPLFSGIGGLIAETGGLLSHTAIIAREYGLPALVSVKRVTRLIQEGQVITLDANMGRVYHTPQKGE